MKVISIDGQEFIIRGRLCRTVQLKEEWDEDILEPNKIIDEIKRRKIGADIFTFTQRLPDLYPKYNFPIIYDNIAVLPITTFEYWWTKQAFKQVRKNVRRSERKGVIIKRVELDNKIIKGIQEIYNETRIRRGTINRHYGMSFEQTKQANITYLDRSYFIGAFLGEELIGFIKLVTTKTKNFARTMGIEGKIKYRGIGYMHALLAEAVKICEEENIPYIVYGKFVYGSKGPDSLTMFKVYSGFQKMEVPRYYVPISMRGRVLFKIGLHKPLIEIIPGFILRALLRIRKLFYEAIYWKDFKADKTHTQSD